MSDEKDFLAANLRIIEIETFSYCNRKCWFCPNSTIDRISTNHILDEDTYLNVIDQLAEIRFSGVVTYSRYNEPLAERELITKRIKQARSRLPHAKLKTNSNGDFATSDFILELRDCGLDELYLQQYLSNSEMYNHEKMRVRMNAKAQTLGFSYSVISDVENQRIEYNLNVPGITVHIRAKNMSVEGNSRTDKVAEFNSEYVRTKACKQPFNNMYIDYNGDVMVCCNVRSDVPDHKNGIMGNIKESKLWEIFQSPKYEPWREHLKEDGPKSGVCKGCKSDIDFVEFIPIRNKMTDSQRD